MDTTITHSLPAYSTREGPPSKSSALRCIPLHVLQSRNSIRGRPRIQRITLFFRGVQAHPPPRHSGFTCGGAGEGDLEAESLQ
jgi:hypothetical protein